MKWLTGWLRWIGWHLWLVKSSKPPVYPKNTRLFYEDEKSITVVVEQPPQKRTILGHERLFLSFPYAVFVVRLCKMGDGTYHFTDLSVGFRADPINTPEDTLYELPLSNFDGTTLRVCLGNAKPKGGTDINKLVEQAISCYWQSRFTDLEKRKDSIEMWKDFTQKGTPFHSFRYGGPLYQIMGLNRASATRVM